jgi:nicotinate-nucleotide--dimethylbenzimidazole phosphoribosyltransferase
MASDQLRQALAAGAEAVEILHDRGTNVWVAGEMGIGNTTASAAILCKLGGLPIEVAVGKGTGVDDTGLMHKRRVVEQALRLHAEAVEPLEVLRCLGGFELAALVGSYLRAAEHRMLLLVDGFIASVAWLVAYKLNPGLKHCTVFSHQSAESGHKALLQSVGMRPLLNLDLRLGEATGALLAWPLLQAAVAFMNDMATFEQAAVDTQLVV